MFKKAIKKEECLNLDVEKLKYAKLVIEMSNAADQLEVKDGKGRNHLPVSSAIRLTNEYAPQKIAQRDRIRKAGGYVIDRAMLVSVEARGDLKAQEYMIKRMIEDRFPKSTVLSIVRDSKYGEDTAQIALFTDERVVDYALKAINSVIESDISLDRRMIEEIEPAKQSIYGLEEREDAEKILGSYAQGADPTEDSYQTQHVLYH